jgi:hypothetical protein
MRLVCMWLIPMPWTTETRDTHLRDHGSAYPSELRTLRRRKETDKVADPYNNSDEAKGTLIKELHQRHCVTTVRRSNKFADELPVRRSQKLFTSSTSINVKDGGDRRG